MRPKIWRYPLLPLAGEGPRRGDEGDPRRRERKSLLAAPLIRPSATFSRKREKGYKQRLPA